MPDETGTPAVKTHKVEFIKAYRYPDENGDWQSAKVGDKIDLHGKFYAGFKKLEVIKDVK